MPEESEKTEAIQNGRINGKFAPGFSGNPAGKPKGARHMSTLLEEAIKKVAEGSEDPEDIMIVKKVIERAKAGDMKAIEHIWDRLEGKAPQKIDVTTDGDKINNDVDELAKRMAAELKNKDL